MVVLLAALVACMAASTAAQSPAGVPTCASKLAACFSYLNATTTPPTSCCGPLKGVVTNEKPCLCSIYGNPALIQAFHINVTQALNLIPLCHVDTVKDPSNLCKGILLFFFPNQFFYFLGYYFLIAFDNSSSSMNV